MHGAEFLLMLFYQQIADAIRLQKKYKHEVINPVAHAYKRGPKQWVNESIKDVIPVMVLVIFFS